MNSPPTKVCNRLKTAAPIIMAKKKSFLSAPMMVMGALSERKTGFTLRCIIVQIFVEVSWPKFRERAKT
jgi:hypothetical protein